jgi:hypothetical protein
MATVCFLAILTACGGGGGGNGTPAIITPPTTPPNPWTNPGGTVATTTLMTVSGISSVTGVTPGNNGNGYVITGLDVAGNIVVTQMDNSGTVLPGWPVTITTPPGYTSNPIQIVTDSTHIGLQYTRVSLAGLQSVWVLFFDSIGNRITDETNFGDNVDAGELILDPDGDTIYISRKFRTGSAAPARIFKASLTSGHAPISMDPSLDRIEKIILQPDGLYAVGTLQNEGRAYKYNKTDFSMIWQDIWTYGIYLHVQDGIFANNQLYVAGEYSGNFTLVSFTPTNTQVFWKENATVPILTDKVTIKSDAVGNVFFTIRNKIGRIDKNSGAVLTANPPTIPSGNWNIIGAKAYFGSGSTIQVFDLTTI